MQPQSDELENEITAIESDLILNRLELDLFGELVLGSGLTSPRRRRAKMNDLLLSWGEWITSGAESKISGWATIEAAMNNLIVEGFDHGGLSDHDSLMILVDSQVDRLRGVDKSLINYEYVSMDDDRARRWAYKYGLTVNRYKNRKSELLLDLSFKIRTKMC